VVGKGKNTPHRFNSMLKMPLDMWLIIGSNWFAQVELMPVSMH
jgi:hypothetical protein